LKDAATEVRAAIKAANEAIEPELKRWEPDSDGMLDGEEIAEAIEAFGGAHSGMSGPALLAQEPARIALVIGNVAYVNVPPLANSANDAHLIAGSLKRARFQVTEYSHPDLDRMRRAIREVGDRLAAAGPKRVAFVQYAGHSVQADGHNYPISVGASIHRESDLGLEAVDASTVMGQMGDAGAGVNIIVLDACRNNPFRGLTRTLGS
jgi:hypothetical protein